MLTPRWLVLCCSLASLPSLSSCFMPDECENALTLTEADSGSSFEILGGCTSLWVELSPLPENESAWEETPELSDDSVLRFDYFMRSDTGTANYAFTPLSEGDVTVTIDRLNDEDTAEPWSATIAIDLDD